VLETTNDDGCSGGTDHHWWSTCTYWERRQMWARSSTPGGVSVCHVGALLAVSCQHDACLSPDRAKYIARCYKQKSVTIGKLELCSYFWLWIVILVRETFHRKRKGSQLLGRLERLFLLNARGVLWDTVLRDTERLAEI